MNKLHVLLWPFVMFVALVAFVGAVHAADGTPPTTEPQKLADLWPAIGWFLAAFSGYGIPRLAKAYTFFHTPFGAIIIGLIGAIIASVIPVFQAGHVTWVALVWAAIGGGSAFFSRLNPSTTADDPPAKSPAARPGASLLLPLALGLGVLTVGCAHGTDGLRQICANANVTLTQATVTGTALYKLGHQTLRANLTKDNADATQMKANSYNTAFDKFLGVMTMLNATKTTTCDTADAIDAGLKKDVNALAAQAGKVIIDAAAALAELQKLIDTSQKTSDANRRIALAVRFPRAVVL